MSKITSIHHRPISIPKATVDLILQETENPGECLALYTFYYYTAIWQQTNRPYSTVGYCAKGLKWGEEKVRKMRKVLKKLKLIKDIETKNEKGQVDGVFVQVNYYESEKGSNYLNFPEKDTKTRLSVFPRRERGQGNAYKNNNKMLSGEKISPGSDTLLGGKAKVDVYVELARELQNIILTRYKTVVKVNHTYWANELRKLNTKDEIPMDLIKEAMEWLRANIKDKYTPQILSATSFREKFSRIAARLEGKEPEPTKQDKEQAKRLAQSHYLPKVGIKEIRKCVALSNLNYMPLRTNWREFTKSLKKQTRKRSIAEYMDDFFISDFVYNWFVEIGNDLKGWKDWNGNLEPWIWNMDSPKIKLWADKEIYRFACEPYWDELITAYKAWENER